MTAARITAASQSTALYHQTSFDLAIARIATALLRWSNRRALSASMGNDEMTRLRANVAAVESRPVYSTLVP